MINLYESNFESPLTIGCKELEVFFNTPWESGTLFIMDADETKDLIDFWNLRAFQPNVIAIPFQWIHKLSPFCKKFILSSTPDNINEVVIPSTTLFSRSIRKEDIKEIRSYLYVDKEDANCYQTWYPTIWRKTPEGTVSITRPILEYKTKEEKFSIDFERPRIEFESLYPEFAERFGNNYRCANVVRLKDYSYKNRIATVFPCDFKDPFAQDICLSVISGLFPTISTNEGIVIFPTYKNANESWNLIEVHEAINHWLKIKKISSNLSSSGRSTREIIHILGGFFNVGSITCRDVIELLNKIAKSKNKSIHCQEFKNKVKKVLGDEPKSVKDWVLKILTDYKVVELGLELKCTCGHLNCYQLTSLGYKLQCQFCLRQFEFPIREPNKASTWVYRVTGPFAYDDYATGGYACSLALHFFCEIIGSRGPEVAWSVGQELTLPNKQKIEADFILWYQQKQALGIDYPAEIIFGEAKSYNRFEKKDINRMKSLAKIFPGAVLVFATLKNSFSSDEVKYIKRLAEWGKKYDCDRHQINATVIVLTGTELFNISIFHLMSSWKKVIGNAEIVDKYFLEIDSLRKLADITQQLYLQMPSNCSMNIKFSNKIT